MLVALTSDRYQSELRSMARRSDISRKGFSDGHHFDCRNPKREWDITSGDTTNAKAWAPAPFNPTVESDLAAVKEAVWQEILRQVQAI